jgi:hypothetical protein
MPWLAGQIRVAPLLAVKRQRPHHIDQIFDLADRAAPHILIAMRQLRRSAGMDADRLCRVELDTVAPGQKHILDDAEDKLVLDQLWPAASGSAGVRSVWSCCRKSRPDRMAFRQVFFQIVIEVVDQRWRQGIGMRQ